MVSGRSVNGTCPLINASKAWLELLSWRPARLAGEIQQVVDVMLDEFASAWTAANPPGR